MSELYLEMPITEIDRMGIVLTIWNNGHKRIGTLTINRKWALFRKANCSNVRRIPLDKLPEVFDKLGK